jgi:nitrate/nitrite transporter NarK
LPLLGALYAMNEMLFSTVLVVLIVTHAIAAAICLFFIFRKIEALRKVKQSKKTLEMQNVLNNHIWLVALLPIAGPIVGYAILRGVLLGVPERGFKVNDPGGSNSSSDDV